MQDGKKLMKVQRKGQKKRTYLIEKKETQGRRKSELKIKKRKKNTGTTELQTSQIEGDVEKKPRREATKKRPAERK